MVKNSKAYEYAKLWIEEQENKTPIDIKKQAAAWDEIAEVRSYRAYIDEKAFG